VFWLTGVTLACTRILLGWQRLRELRRSARFECGAPIEQAIRRLAGLIGAGSHVRIALSSRISGPMLIGWLRPLILLPPAIVTALPHDQIEMIIAHELAHFRRHDQWVNLIQVIIETLLFYHPIVAWVSGRIRIERENACDDLAVAATQRRLDYVEMLAALEYRRRPGPLLALGVDDGQIVARIRRLVERGEPRATRGATTPAAGLALLLAILVGAPLVDDWTQAPSAQSQSTGSAPVDADLLEPHRGQQLVPAAAPVELDRKSDPIGSKSIDNMLQHETEEPSAALHRPAAARPALALEPDRLEVIAVRDEIQFGLGPTDQMQPEPGLSQPEPGVDKAFAIETEPTALDPVQADLMIDPLIPDPLATDKLTSEQLAMHSRTPSPAFDPARELARPVLSPAAQRASQSSDVPTEGGNVLNRALPIYPRTALRRERSGQVEIEVLVDHRGRVTDFKILSEMPTGLGFAQAAGQAARDWQFEPFTRAGHAVEHRARIEFNFDPGDGCLLLTGTRIPRC